MVFTSHRRELRTKLLSSVVEGQLLLDFLHGPQAGDTNRAIDDRRSLLCLGQGDETRLIEHEANGDGGAGRDRGCHSGRVTVAGPERRRGGDHLGSLRPAKETASKGEARHSGMKGGGRGGGGVKVGCVVVVGV